MGNHKKNIFWPLTHQNPNAQCTIVMTETHDNTYYQHVKSFLLKGLRIARHNKVVHAKKNTKFFLVTNANNLDNKPLEQSRNGFSNAYAHNQPGHCQAKLRPNNLCIIGAVNWTQTPITPSPAITIQLIDFTYCHDKFLDQALTRTYQIWSTNSQITKQWLKNQLTDYYRIRSKRGYTRTLN